VEGELAVLVSTRVPDVVPELVVGVVVDVEGVVVEDVGATCPPPPKDVVAN
jgi:hypothetical protein